MRSFGADILESDGEAHRFAHVCDKDSKMRFSTFVVVVVLTACSLLCGIIGATEPNPWLLFSRRYSMKRLTISILILALWFFSPCYCVSVAESQKDGMSQSTVASKNGTSKQNTKTKEVSKEKLEEVFRQGRAYYWGLDGENVDRVKGYKGLKWAMDRGHLEAKGLVAWIQYINGAPWRPVDKDWGCRLADEALEAGDESYFTLETQAQGLLEGFGVRRDVDGSWKVREKAAKLLEERARDNDPIASLFLARYWQYGFYEHFSGLASSSIYSSEEKQQKCREYLRQAADQGLPEAMCELGMALYEQGAKRENDPAESEALFAEAYALFQKAAEKKCPNAPACLGACEYNGCGVEKNVARAIQHFEEGDRMDSPFASFFLACCWLDASFYAEDSDVVREIRRRMIGFQQCAKDLLDVKQSLRKNGVANVGSTPVAKLWLNFYELNSYDELAKPEEQRVQQEEGAVKCYSLLQNLESFDKLALKTMERYPANVDSEILRAYFSLSLIPEAPVACKKLQNVVTNSAKATANSRNKENFMRDYVAFKLCHKASLKHYYPAFANMAESYFFGLGVDADLEEAVKSCRLAARNGSGFMCYTCGGIYEFGKVTRANPRTAHDWFLRAIELGEPKGRIGLARLCVKGAPNGVIGKPNYELAREELVLAAEEDEIEAILFLAYWYRDGWHVKKDINEAAKWFRKGSELDNMFCQFELAKFLMQRQGATYGDLEEAISLFQRSAAQGYQAARDALDYYSSEDPYSEFLKFSAPIGYVPKKSKDKDADVVVAMTNELNKIIVQHLSVEAREIRSSRQTDPRNKIDPIKEYDYRRHIFKYRLNDEQRTALESAISDCFNRYYKKAPDDVKRAVDNWLEATVIDESNVLKGDSERTQVAKERKRQLEDKYQLTPADWVEAQQIKGQLVYDSVNRWLDDGLLAGAVQGFGGYAAYSMTAAGQLESAENEVEWAERRDEILKNEQQYKARRERDDKLRPQIRALLDLALDYGWTPSEQ